MAYHLQPSSRKVSASKNGKASKPMPVFASLQDGRALFPMPFASAEGSAFALGFRITVGSPLARGRPWPAASSARQRKSGVGIASSEASGATLAGTGAEAGLRGGLPGFFGTDGMCFGVAFGDACRRVGAGSSSCGTLAGDDTGGVAVRSDRVDAGASDSCATT